MWPFKKKTIVKDVVPETVKTIICIPGMWNDWNEFMLSLVSSSDGQWIAAGSILLNSKDQRHYTIEFCERDEDLKKSFTLAGMVTRVTDSFLDDIGNHKHIIYISGVTGNLDQAEYIAFAAAAVLNAGGLGIKIETAGKAFQKDKWLNLINTFEQPKLYEMFVIDSIVDKGRAVYSCGMHNLGYKDTITTGDDFQKCVGMITIFSYYQLVDKPTIENRNTFSTDISSPKYRITDEPNQPNKGHELFENPFGMWRLTKE
jgi:hypothetical protein